MSLAVGVRKVLLVKTENHLRSARLCALLLILVMQLNGVTWIVRLTLAVKMLHHATTPVVKAIQCCLIKGDRVDF